jgi:ParB/RepB/Spo0J family partition protein
MTIQAERIVLPMPVTKQTITCNLIEVDPDDCVVSKFNRRQQSLLRCIDPDIQSLIQSINSEGQRDPVLIRLLPKGSERKYEIIYGSRRRFAVSEINKSRTAENRLKLRAWVSDKISDIDAQQLAVGENENRSEISSWETALYVASFTSEYIQSNPKATQTEIAAALKMDRTTVFKYQNLARLPENLVLLMQSPSDISVFAGQKLVSLIDEMDQQVLSDAISELSQQPPFDKTGSLIKALKNYHEHHSQLNKVSKRERLVFESKCGAKVVFSKHRNENDRFKLDISNCSEKNMEAILEYIKQLKAG